MPLVLHVLHLTSSCSYLQNVYYFFFYLSFIGNVDIPQETTEVTTQFVTHDGTTQTQTTQVEVTTTQAVIIDITSNLTELNMETTVFTAGNAVRDTTEKMVGVRLTSLYTITINKIPWINVQC